jgi:hypothetical protein
MNNILIYMLSNNPVLFYFLLIFVMIIVIAFLFLVILKGYNLKILNFGLSKNNKGDGQQSLVVQPIPQSQNLQISINTGISEEDIRRAITDRYELMPKKPEAVIEKYLSPSLNERIAYTIAARLDIRNRLAKIVCGYGGGWAGCSINPIEKYLSMADGRKLMSDSLYKEIEDLLGFMDVYYYFSDIPDQDFIKIQSISADVNIELEQRYNELKEQRALPN